MSKNTSKPAFPTALENREGDYGTYGMSIREYAAIKAMQGLLANSGGPVQANAMCGWGLCNCDYEQVAEFAVKQADSLLAELVKGGAA